MRQVIVALALAVCLLVRGGSRGAQVPLPTDQTISAYGQSCILMHEVVDVIADPITGTPVLKADSPPEPVRWPKGFTAWRVGSEVEVENAWGMGVLTTGARYSICPSDYLNGWVVGIVTPCPDCKLGFGLD